MSARIAGALTRSALLLHRFLRVRTGRLLFTGLLATAVTGLVLAVPVIAGTGTGSPSVVLDSSSSTPPGVDLGVAPAPAPTDERVESAPAGTTSAAPAPSAPAGPETDEPSTSAVPTPAATTPPSLPTAPSTLPSPSPSPSSAAGAPPSSSSGRTTPSAPPTSDTAPPPAESAALDPTVDLLALLDEARAAAGCEPLRRDAALADAAEAHSTAMREEGDLDLPDVDGRSPREQGASAAAVARGESDPDDVLDDWLDDDADVLRNCGLASVGIGRADGDDGPWWTLLLA